jgi:hypothetical protein
MTTVLFESTSSSRAEDEYPLFKAKWAEMDSYYKEAGMSCDVFKCVVEKLASGEIDFKVDYCVSDPTERENKFRTYRQSADGSKIEALE